jgi:molybdate transport system substrate-binding protein
VTRWTAAALLVSLAAGACQTAEAPTAPPLHVFSSNGVGALLREAQPDLERAAGRAIAFEFSTAAELRRRIAGPDEVSVAVLTAPLVDDLIALGRLAAGTRRDIAQVGVGVAIRAGVPAASVATPDDLKALLLGARSVAFTAEGQSRPVIDAAFERLGIAAQMQPRSLLRGPGAAPQLVVDGEAEVVLTLLSELVGVPGLQVLGPFPAALQRSVTFAAARGAGTSAGDAADRLLHALAGPELRNRLAKHGLDPPAP